ncbi:MAG: dephospho-CoA kinase [Rickettsiales bacterium]|nr:dephospho-CoA kinase [Pseudomonadota bacterium]MDA0965814.1 dephospho-CoA kinase [Pseudomonadota bacterium]MDG4542716.1 dephospho-CoA kinase [Rickettsiales bacterium]MDG4545220.1 dephospho-CoA kinase [Rickettsiales bacterium]MDG4547343.1 dephospho-CoA kinase [Rickettsiales bacterium]
MIVIGLTGSIATGKSFVARCFLKLGAAVFDADKNVHELLTFGGNAVKTVRELFPESYHEGEICRSRLGEIVFSDSSKRKKLEEIIHPLVDKRRKDFLKQCKKDKVKIAVLEIPLLFETERQSLCDYVVVTTVDSYTQEKRALERNGMTKEKFDAVNSLQMASRDKVKKADFVIDTSFSEFAVFREVKNVMNKILSNND